MKFRLQAAEIRRTTVAWLIAGCSVPAVNVRRVNALYCTRIDVHVQNTYRWYLEKILSYCDVYFRYWTMLVSDFDMR